MSGHFTATDAEGVFEELFTSVSSGKTSIAAAITDKGVSASGSDTFTQLAGKIDSITTGVESLLGTLSFTGTYATELSTRTNSWAFNPDTGHVLLVLQGANTTSYENIVFTIASAPSGITLLGGYSSALDTSDPAGNMYGCIIQGVTAPINISIAVNTRNSANDYYQADLTITYA